MSLLDDNLDLTLEDLILGGLIHLINIHNENGPGREFWSIKSGIIQNKINLTIDDRIDGDGEMVMGYNYLCAGDAKICKIRFFNTELFHRNAYGDVNLYDKESVRYDKNVGVFFVGPYRLIYDYASWESRMVTVHIQDIINKDLKKGTMIF